MLSYIEISKSAILHNYDAFRAFIPSNTSIIAVLKANAYGHGLEEVALIIDSKVERYAIDDIEELIRLRRVTDKPAVIIGYVAKNELERGVVLDAEFDVYDIERVRLLNSIGQKFSKKIKVHLEIDSFLGRQGVLLKDLPEFLDEIKKLDHIELYGAFSHFSNIEDTTDFSHAQRQIDNYNKAIEIIKSSGFDQIKRHISSTAGTLVYESGENNFIRLGIGLYGMWPSIDLQKRTSFELKPAFKWISHIAQIKTLPENYPIGYGLTYVTNKETKIAVIPQGYSDGYDRKLSNSGEILVHGKRCKVLGRVSMNMLVIDVTDVECNVEDEVVLIGDEISAEEVATKVGTINYEITTRVNPIIKRILV